MVPDAEIKIGYLNIRGLTDAYHGEYLNSDRNLLNLDILVIAETHLSAKTHDEPLSDLLRNFQVLHRFDATDGKEHMGLLMISPQKSKFMITKMTFHIEVHGTEYMQVLICTIPKVTLKTAFIYIIPNKMMEEEEKKNMLRELDLNVKAKFHDNILNPKISYSDLAIHFVNL